MCSRWIARVRTAFSMTLGLEGARVPLGNECFAYLSGFRRTPRLSLCVSRTGGEGKYRFRLTQGAHRFYCAVASGFSHVPAVEEDSESG